MKKIIKLITRIESEGFHPAIGYKYIILFEDNTDLKTDDDELLEQFGYFQNYLQLIGKEFTLNHP